MVIGQFKGLQMKLKGWTTASGTLLFPLIRQISENIRSLKDI